MKGYYDAYQMRELLKKTTDWDPAVIDSWGLKQLTAIFLERKDIMEKFLIDYGFINKETVRQFSFKKLSYEYYNYLPLVEEKAAAEEYITDQYKALAAQEKMGGIDEHDTYTWDELVDMYPHVTEMTASSLNEFLVAHHIRLLDDEFAQPMKH